MLVTLHKNKNAQIVLGLLFGIVFGFLLQKGGATDYDVITGQLLLTDFTVLKLMLSAVYCRHDRISPASSISGMCSRMRLKDQSAPM